MNLFPSLIPSSRTIRWGGFFSGFLLFLFLMGCATPSSQVVKLTKEEHAQMNFRADQARQDFNSGNYSGAVQKLESLCAQKTVNEPLYQCEMASAALLAGDHERAMKALRDAHTSIEGFFDQHSEKKAASLWGKESEKVFKGDPYERSTLYLLLALLFLEQGNVDNALAATKTGLLADSDTANQAYQSDFALLQLIAAKCYDLRNEPDLRDQMLLQTFKSFTTLPHLSKKYAQELLEEYEQQKISRLEARLCALAPASEIEIWLRKTGVDFEKAKQVAFWAKEASSFVHPLDYNALILIWRGTPPKVIRTGEYGEQRTLVHGESLPGVTYSILLDSTADYDGILGLGDLDYQATTRGGRKMDSVLDRQANTKAALSSSGNAMLATATQGTGSSEADAIILVAGILMKGISAAAHPEADIRYWQNLPHTFEIVPLRLESGTHHVELVRWLGPLPVVQQKTIWTVDAKQPLSVLHLRPSLQFNKKLKLLSTTSDDELLRLLLLTDPKSVDSNQDGEITSKEYQQAYATLGDRFDLNPEESLSPEKRTQMIRALQGTFFSSMSHEEVQK